MCEICVSYGAFIEYYYHLASNAVQSCRYLKTFRISLLPPSRHRGRGVKEKTKLGYHSV
jgi:hypothetical protein